MVVLGRVKLVNDKQRFADAFKRFSAESLYGWSPDKDQYIGMEGNVIQFHEIDQTIAIQFTEGTGMPDEYGRIICDFPMEAVEE